ncbi:phasin family protein [Breznakiella homolactica]|uniref:Phasin family protein n=1 Tax=Breznakiella homolactica TaxID=2798577 RepID=A0A7T7XQX4_9SPIR|nr:phasin family protein [Breznakiella homolactica]QQO10859.1 phasin family protein [Breznakiella homolactica]
MNLIESTFYAGIGLALKGKEKIEAAANKFAKEQKMSAAEGKKFVDGVMASSEQTKKDLDKKINDAIKDAVGKMGLATKKEVDTLKAKVTKLETELKAAKAK